MIVVAIIGILAAIAIPKFADLINKAKEGSTKGGLSSVRSAIQVYYGDSEGWYPADSLACLTLNSKYIAEIPIAKTPGTGHADSRVVTNDLIDAPGWTYGNDTTDAPTWGLFLVNCKNHEDLKGQSSASLWIPWSSF